MEKNNNCTPLVSVIVPNYNHSQYLGERINSILNQTYQNFELILLDDNSTDNSRDILEKYRNNPHVSRIEYNDTNSGSPFKQWEKGINLSSGDLIWIAESDDSCFPEMLEELVREFVNNERCVLAYCKSNYYHGGKLFKTINNTKKTVSMSGKTFIKVFLSCGNSVSNASSALFKKEVAIKIKKDYLDYKGAGDRLFWIYLSEFGDVSIVRKRLNIFRLHDNNSTSRFYYYGINQIEDKLILDYLCRKGYVGRLLLLASRVRYCNSQVAGRAFATEEIREKVEKCWNLTKSERFLVKIYRILLNVLKKTGML